MKSIDLKSLLIGILGTALVMVLMGQASVKIENSDNLSLEGVLGEFFEKMDDRFKHDEEMRQIIWDQHEKHKIHIVRVELFFSGRNIGNVLNRSGNNFRLHLFTHLSMTQKLLMKPLGV